MKKVLIAPSLLSADFTHLKDDIDLVDAAKADWLHFDVMDGHFVPNISFGVPIFKYVSKISPLVNDVHLMISAPQDYYKKFIDLGAQYITFHYEAFNNNADINKLIDEIHKCGAKAGLSIKPNTNVEVILPFIKDLDLILIMAVEPGFGGQSFISNSLAKIAYLRKYIDENELSTLIEVDGGINEITAKLVKDAGADVLVAGSYLFGHGDIKERIALLKE